MGCNPTGKGRLSCPAGPYDGFFKKDRLYEFREVRAAGRKPFEP